MQSFYRVARNLSFWSRSSPPYIDFPLIVPAPSAYAYTSDIIPSHIIRPVYANNGIVDQKSIPSNPVIWSKPEIAKVSYSLWPLHSVLLMLTFLDKKILQACKKDN